MASSSVSQESLDLDDFDNTARRNRIRVHRGHGRGTLPYRTLPDRGGVGGGDALDGDKEGRNELGGENGDHNVSGNLGLSVHTHLPADHESPTRGAAARLKDKRSRAIHMKGKLPKDKRKLREKRRSTGVVHCLPSTESTGDSLDDDDDDEDTGMETKKNTTYNEVTTTGGHHHQAMYEARHSSNSSYSPKRNKSPSDLEADLEDNQDYDSTVSHSETNLTLIGRSESSEMPQNAPGRHTGPGMIGRKVGGISNSNKYSPESRRAFQFNNTSSVVSSGADSPSRTNPSPTSSSSYPFLSRYREADSLKTGGSNSSSFVSTNTSNSNENIGSLPGGKEQESPRRVYASSAVGEGSPLAIQPRPVGFSVFRDSSNVGGVKADKPSYTGSNASTSRFWDSNSSASGIGSLQSRIASYHSPRSSAGISMPPVQSAASMQQQNENISQLEKQLEKEREENRNLQQKLDEKDKKIVELEKAIELLNKRS